MLMLLEKKPIDFRTGTKTVSLFYNEDTLKNTYERYDIETYILDGVKLAICEFQSSIYKEFNQIFSSITDPNEFRAILKKHYGAEILTPEDLLFLKRLYEFYDYYIIDGKNLPIEVKYIPEGSILSGNIPVVTITNTDPNHAWLVNTVACHYAKIITTNILETSKYLAIKKRMAVSLSLDSLSKIDGHVYGNGYGLKSSVYSVFGPSKYCNTNINIDDNIVIFTRNEEKIEDSKIVDGRILYNKESNNLLYLENVRDLDSHILALKNSYKEIIKDNAKIHIKVDFELSDTYIDVKFFKFIQTIHDLGLSNNIDTSLVCSTTHVIERIIETMYLYDVPIDNVYFDISPVHPKFTIDEVVFDIIESMFSEDIINKEEAPFFDRKYMGNLYVYYDNTKKQLVWYCDKEVDKHLEFLNTIKADNIYDMNNLLASDKHHLDYYKVIHKRINSL